MAGRNKSPDIKQGHLLGMAGNNNTSHVPQTVPAEQTTASAVTRYNAMRAEERDTGRTVPCRRTLI